MEKFRISLGVLRANYLSDWGPWCPSTPAWVIRSEIDFSRSSILQDEGEIRGKNWWQAMSKAHLAPMSSIRLIIWSLMHWNLSWTFCNKFWTCGVKIQVICNCIVAEGNSRIWLTPRYSLDPLSYFGLSSFVAPFRQANFWFLNSFDTLLTTKIILTKVLVQGASQQNICDLVLKKGLRSFL
jgi:hypothetical protein